MTNGSSLIGTLLPLEGPATTRRKVFAGFDGFFGAFWTFLGAVTSESTTLR